MDGQELKDEKPALPTATLEGAAITYKAQQDVALGGNTQTAVSDEDLRNLTSKQHKQTFTEREVAVLGSEYQPQ